MTTEVKIDKPQPKQVEFFKARTRFVGYGGARGGGKSWAARTKAVLMAFQWAGIRILLLRRSFPELHENHVLPLQQMLGGAAKYKETDKAFTFPNGSRLKLGYCANDGDLQNYQGHEYDVIFMEEATHFTEHMFKVFRACLRGANNFPKRFYLTCNPGGVGHEWVKRLFVSRKYIEADVEKAEDYTFIQARVYDNKILLELDPDYLKNLQGLDEKQRKAWLDGNWDVFDGQYFNEFNADVHVIEPFEIPGHWELHTAMDYGLDMMAHYWIARDDQGNIYVTNEIYESELIVSEAVKRIKHLEHREPLFRFAPPDMWHRQQAIAKSTAILFEEQGLSLTKAINDRVAGWLAIKELLKVEDKLQPDGSVIKKPRLQIFRNCVHLIKYLPQLQYCEKNPSDTSRQPHEITHAPDALRYFCISYTQPALPKVEQKGFKSDIEKFFEEDYSHEEKGAIVEWD